MSPSHSDRRMLATGTTRASNPAAASLISNLQKRRSLRQPVATLVQPRLWRKKAGNCSWHFRASVSIHLSFHAAASPNSLASRAHFIAPTPSIAKSTATQRPQRFGRKSHRKSSAYAKGPRLLDQQRRTQRCSTPSRRNRRDQIE